MVYSRIGDYLYYEFIEKYQIHQTLVSDLAGISPNRLSEIIRHRRRITVDTDLRLCKFFGLTDGYFLKIQNELEIKETKAKINKDLQQIKPYAMFKKAKL